MKNKLVSMIPVLLLVGIILLFSSQPYQEQTIIPSLRGSFSEDRLSERMPDLTIHYHQSNVNAKQQPFQFIEFVFRKSAHLFVYGVLGALLFLGLRPFRLRGWGKALLVLEIGALVAIVDEINQARSLSRTGIPQDVAVDLAGVILGMLFAALLTAVLRRLEGES